MEYKSAEQRIKEYLDDFASKDEVFAEKYTKSGKTVGQCIEYIKKFIQEHCDNNKSVVVEDEVVFGIAVHYFDDDVELQEEEIIKSLRKTAINDFAKHYEMSEKDIEEARMIAIKNAANEMKENMKKKPKAKEEPKEQQLSLF